MKRRIGFSTGAVAKGDFRAALRALVAEHILAVELSALRLDELEPLRKALKDLDLSTFEYVSVHAPSSFPAENEADVANALKVFTDKGWFVIVHPNVIRQLDLWRSLGSQLLIENMDRRKPVGRTAAELFPLMEALPKAGLCLDLGHARHVDPTMIEAALMLKNFGDRIRQVHLSEVNERSHHDPISVSSIEAFRSVADRVPESAPIILEPLIDEGQSTIRKEVEKAAASLAVPTAIAS